MSESDEVIHLDSSNFDEVIKSSKVPVLVDFWAQWCMPCLAMGPVVEKMAKEFKGKALIAKVNVDENPDLAQRVQALSIPLFIIYKNGEEVERIVGAIGMALADKLRKHL
ncbi:MAG: thioredoxin [Candidatus Odinarchaeia archaeon]